VNRNQFLVINLIVASFLIIPFAQTGAVQTTETDTNIDEHIHFVLSETSPRSQFFDNMPIQSVMCSEDLELIMKKSNGMPACVKSESVAVLIERGWGLHVLPDYEKSENNNSEQFEKGELSVTTHDVVYFENYQGYLARPETDGIYPGIVMIHEWWGLNDNIKQMAEKLASHGYVVLAVDLFGAPAATTADEARQLTSAYVVDDGVANMNGAIKYLVDNYDVSKLASIGWCFGGGQSLNLALHTDSMDATVIYYGSITSDKSKLSSIKWPVLGIFAGLDQGIPVDSVKQFESSLNDLGIENQIHIYPDVNHAFANPSGDRYAHKEAQDAWQKTIEFLNTHL
jgi:carboxymethylenebutenolidase